MAHSSLAPPLARGPGCTVYVTRIPSPNPRHSARTTPEEAGDCPVVWEMSRRGCERRSVLAHWLSEADL
jgi:hypothetical protein